MSNNQPSRTDALGDTNNHTLRLATALVFAGLALILRFAPLPENFACFGALSLFCGLMLKPPMRWALPMLTLFAADCLGHFLGSPQMGFYSVPAMILNYLGMAAIVLIGTGAGRFADREKNDWQPWVAVVVGAFSGSVAFFLISNFGAWLDPLMGYERTLSGLMQCYALGIPFFRPTLISDMIFGVGFYATYQLIVAPMGVRVAKLG